MSKSNLKADLKVIGVASALCVLFMLLISYKNGFGTGVTTGLFFAASYIFPGFYLISVLSPDSGYVERVILGIITWMGGAGIIMYYLNWVGVSSRTVTFVLPAIGLVLCAMHYLGKDTRMTAKNKSD